MKYAGSFTSEFLNNSVDAGIDGMVCDHIMGPSSAGKPGATNVSGGNQPRGGDTEWNGEQIASGTFFNGETGVNYTPQSKASSPKIASTAKPINAKTPYDKWR